MGFDSNAAMVAMNILAASAAIIATVQAVSARYTNRKTAAIVSRFETKGNRWPRSRGKNQRI